MLNGEAIYGKEEWERFETEVQEVGEGLAWLRKFGEDDLPGAKEDLVGAVESLLNDVAELIGGSVTRDEDEDAGHAREADYPRATLKFHLPERTTNVPWGRFEVAFDFRGLYPGRYIDRSDTGLEITYSGKSICLGPAAAVVYATPFVRRHLVLFLKDFLASLKKRLDLGCDVTPPDLAIEADEGRED